MRVLIASTFVPFVYGGGTKIVFDLKQEMQKRGFEVDSTLIPLNSHWSDLSSQTVGLRLFDLSESSGNRIDRLITIRYPSYALRHPNKVAWFIHHHREAYDLWDSEWCGIPHSSVGTHYREMIQHSDTSYLRECQKIFSNSQVVADRLKRFNDIDVDGLLYPPLPVDNIFHSGEFGDYIFYASRVNPIKRQDLAIRAMRYTDPDVKLVLGGAVDDTNYLKTMEQIIEEEGVADRVEFKGWLTEEVKANLMAGCCGALYLAYDEDSYGYVTLEAFHSEKPVITLTDSGGSLEVIEDGHNGLICEPEPKALAEAMNRLWRDRNKARAMGKNAHDTLQRFQIDWDHVIENLTS